MLYYAYRFMRHPKIWKEISPYESFISYARALLVGVSIPVFVKELTHVNQVQPYFSLGNKTRDKPVLLSLVMALKPVVVVETGIGGGYSSGFILEGMRSNGFGKLYSIDKADTYNPEYYGFPKGQPIGGVVPSKLRKRNGWEMLLGGSGVELVPLLARLGKIDLFVHDSLHTQEMMMFEYMTAWNYLRKGGVLISHDIWKPWFEFCKEVDRKPVIHGVFGGIVK